MTEPLANPLPPSTPHTRRILLYLVAGAFIARLIFVSFFTELYAANPDYDNFHRFAVNLVQGEGLMVRNAYPVSERMPLYVVFLAAHYFLFGVWALPVQLTQALLGAGVVLLSFRVARQVGLRESLSLLVAGVIAVHPGAIYFTALLISETIAQLLFLFFFSALVKLFARPSVISGVWCGVAAGFSVLCRPEPSAFLLLAVPALMILIGGSQRKKLLVSWSVAVVLMLVVLSPWAMRNFHVHRKWRFLYHSSYVLGDAVNPYSSESYYTEKDGKERDWVEKNIIPHIRKDSSFDEADTARNRALWIYIRAHWQELLPTWLKRFGHTWQPWTPGGERSSVAHSAFRISFAIFEGLLLLGMLVAIAVRQYWRVTACFWLYVVYFSALHTLYPAMVRYRLPILPVLTILAVIGLSAAWTRLRTRRTADPVAK